MLLGAVDAFTQLRGEVLQQLDLELCVSETGFAHEADEEGGEGVGVVELGAERLGAAPGSLGRLLDPIERVLGVLRLGEQQLEIEGRPGLRLTVGREPPPARQLVAARFGDLEDLAVGPAFAGLLQPVRDQTFFLELAEARIDRGQVHRPERRDALLQHLLEDVGVHGLVGDDSEDGVAQRHRISVNSNMIESGEHNHIVRRFTMGPS